jgi:predicted nucleic acid-binding protein
MKNGLVIADAGPIFSLALIDKLELLKEVFDEVKIPRAVWNEISFLISKDKKLINELRPIFMNFLNNKRFYSIDLLNRILLENKEKPIGF